MLRIAGAPTSPRERGEVSVPRMRQKPKFARPFKLIWVVQSVLQKYFASDVGQITLTTRPSCSSKGRFAIVTSAEQDAVDATDAQRRSAFDADGEVVWF